MIILSVIEGILGFIIISAALMLLFGGFQWIMMKFFGTHFYGKFQVRQAMRESDGYERAVQEYAISQPELVKEAIARCKKKGFAKTHYNVLVEIKKIENQNNNEPDLKDIVVSKLKDFREWIKNDNSISHIEKIERLNQLKKEGALSEFEFQELKKEILHKKTGSENSIQNKYHSKPVNSNYDYATDQYEMDMRKAFTIINMLYFEFKEQDIYLKNMQLLDIHKSILESGNTITLINSYENLFKLYSNGIINKEEFINKKKHILYKSLNK